MKLRAYKDGDVEKIELGISKLMDARLVFKEAGATKSLAKTRRALRSAEGARRHALRLRFVAERDQERG